MAIIATIPRQNRQGVYLAPSIVVPAGITEILVKLNVTTATYTTTGKSVTMRVYVLNETNGTWQLTSTALWETGAYTDPETGEVNPPPVLSPSIMGLTGRTLRAEFEIPISMSIGATVETLP